MLRYFLLVNIYALLLFALYLLLLRNSKAPRWSRLYLLLSVGISILLPYVQMPLPVGTAGPVSGAFHVLLPTVAQRPSSLRPIKSTTATLCSTKNEQWR
ncbi:MAG: hypothetical protein EOO03_18355, partial [Chitinophagaceae bacterium]